MNSATYSYLVNSSLVEQILFKENSTTRMTTTKGYDLLNRLTSIQNTPALAGQAPWSHAYTYNTANQRTRATLADGSYWRYEYDELGQVERGARCWSDGTPVAGQQFEYTHDDIGNRTETRAGGDENGLNLRVASYSPDALNQYDSRTVPGAVDVMGIALATSTVTVNSQSAYRKGEYFRAQVTVANDPNAVWQPVSVATNGVTGASGNVFVAGTPESFAHDLDGNLTSDGRWAYTWDAENRLLKVESHAGAPAASKRKVEWTYDFKGRRIRQTEYVWNASTLNYDPATDLKLIHDGWRCLAELNATINSLLRNYVWGLDLSGTMDGAGGVGGLLAVWDASTLNNQPSTHFACYDGNGNVVGLVQGSDGVVSAVYEYDPFGRTLRKTGSMANSQPFRFSTKRANDITGLVLYEYRAYSPEVGRWPNRDPIGELGGENLYGFVENDPIGFVDFNGLTTVKKHAWSITQQQAMSGIWGWTDLESQEEKPAKLKMKKKLCLCVVTKKPEMVFTISVQTARSGKQSWKESAVFDGVTYPDTSVYVGSGLASFSKQHEEKRFQAWKTALTGFWPGHYEDPAAKLTAPTCDELKAKIDALRQQAATEWETSAEGRELIRRLIEIGQEGASVSRWVRKSGFGSVRVVYDTN